MAGQDFDGSWIYIIMAVVAGIISLAKSAIKKMGGEPENVPQLDEQLLEEFEKKNLAREKGNKKKEYQFHPSQEGGRISKTVNNISIELEEEETEGIDFDLRKAVIYNEILNRKYDW